ncbi:MFS transporter small subunit [Mycobacterium simiae]
MTALRVVSWLWVGVPFSYGLYQLVVKIPALFLS